MAGARFDAGPLAPVLRGLAGALPFSVISNNCWGAHVYQAMGLEYATPFVGMFIPPASYIELLREFDTLIQAPLTFTRKSRSPTINAWRENARLDYPIGVLDGRIEINFQHYAGEAEVLAKWPRRCERLTNDPDRRFFKFDDREGATEGDIEAFCGLPIANQLCFTAKPYRCATIVVPSGPGSDQVPDGLTLARVSRRYFNTLRWISTAPRWAPIPSLI